MRFIIHLKDQFKSVSPLLFKAWITYFIFYCLLLSISAFFFNISPDYLTRDPAALLKGKFYTGAISNLGILFWTAGATLCWFSYFALLKYAPESRLKNMLLHFGIVTTFLLLDDLYMWHEEMFPKYIKIHEHWLYAGYLMYFLFILIKFRAILLQTEFFILASAFFFMGCSMAIDVFDKKLIALLSFYPTAETLLEDSFKSIGILTWLLYFARVSFVNVLPLVVEKSKFSFKLKVGPNRYNGSQRSYQDAKKHKE